MNVCKKIDEYEKSQKKPSPENELFFISIKNDGIYLNDIKIIDKKAELQFAIFRILLDLYFEEFFSKKEKYISVKQIAALLKNKGIFLDDFESQIYSNIYLIRTSIKSVSECLNADSIIESKKWEGYRINNRVFLKK